MSTLRLAKKICIVLKFSNDSHSLILQIIDPSLVSFCVPIRHHTHSQRRLFWVSFPALKTANFREPNRKNARFDPMVCCASRKLNRKWRGSALTSIPAIRGTDAWESQTGA
eukprot:sb/3477203/